ncbi:MAG: TlyA family RNA methyltransferase [Ruminococcaceae bacterium]|nr:TlyA family RNA methyltransferase [Oscillospiraceae bacterium]
MRADVYLTVNGHTESRQKARRLIEEGLVTVDGKKLRKPSEEIREGAHAVEVGELYAFVGRGGCKLEAALNAFRIDVTGLSAIDIGASTGGFTDCLLQRGAARVWAVDSGEGQLAPRLQSDARVVSMERCNARYLTVEDIGQVTDLIVMDVSFISATYLIPLFPSLLGNGGEAVCLIKPQFEVGKQAIGKGGIVKDRRDHRMAVCRVLDAARAAGMKPVGLIPSPITGGDGNREFLVHLVRGDSQRLELTNDQILSVTG